MSFLTEPNRRDNKGLAQVDVTTAGVHTLQVVFDAGSLSGSQKTLFLGMDILLTAGLIAGGSKGINAITSLLGSFLEASKEQAKSKKKP